MARPSEYTKAKGDAICKQMLRGQGLLQICSAEGMPDRVTVYRWLERHSEFRNNFARAREGLMDFYAEQILVVAFNESGDIVIDGDKTVANHAKVQRDKLKVDSLKWIASKLFPRQYGDKLEIAGNKPGLSHEEALKELDARGDVNVRWDVQHVIIDPNDNGLRERIAELEAELARRDGKAEPLQITYRPGPFPTDTDPQVLADFLDMIRDCVPMADTRDPAAVLAEVTQICRDAMTAHYAAGNATECVECA